MKMKKIKSYKKYRGDIDNPLKNRFICPICGQRKIHYRLSGYRCHFAEHYDLEQELIKNGYQEKTA